MYTLLANTIYLSHSEQVAEGTIFRKHTVLCNFHLFVSTVDGSTEFFGYLFTAGDRGILFDLLLSDLANIPKRKCTSRPSAQRPCKRS